MLWIDFVNNCDTSSIGQFKEKEKSRQCKKLKFSVPEEEVNQWYLKFMNQNTAVYIYYLEKQVKNYFTTGGHN